MSTRRASIRSAESQLLVARKDRNRRSLVRNGRFRPFPQHESDGLCRPRDLRAFGRGPLVSVARREAHVGDRHVGDRHVGDCQATPESAQRERAPRRTATPENATSQLGECIRERDPRGEDQQPRDSAVRLRERTDRAVHQLRAQDARITHSANHRLRDHPLRQSPESLRRGRAANRCLCDQQSLTLPSAPARAS